MENIAAKNLMKPDFLKIDESRPLSELIGLLKGTKYNNILVFKNKKYTGMASLRFLLRKRIDVTKTKTKSVVFNFPVLSPDTSVYKIAELMYSSGARILPVKEKDSILGVVPSQRVIEIIKSMDELKHLKAKDIATKKPVAIEETESLDKAIRLMKDNNIKKLLVLKDRKLSGVLSYDNILSRLLSAGLRHGKTFKLNPEMMHSSADEKSVFDLPIINFIDQSFATFSSEESINKIVNMIRKKKIGIVQSNLKPKAIITTKNLLEAMLLTKKEKRNLQVIGLPKMDEIDYAKVERTITGFYDKIERKINQKPLLRIQFKKYNESGLRSKHSIHIMLSFAGLILNSKASGWTLISCLQDAIKILNRVVSKKLKNRFSRERK